LRAFTCTDTVIDLEIYSYLSTVLGILTFARNRIGFFFNEAGYRQKLHTHRIFFQPGSPLYRHYDRIALMLGAPIVPPHECCDHVRTALGIIAHVPKPSSGRIAIGCGCSDLAEERKLTPAQWSRHVFATAPERTRDVFFLADKDDTDDVKKIIAAVQALGSDGWCGKLIDLSGTMPLRDSLRVLAGCDEFWGIESSLLHYARL